MVGIGAEVGASGSAAFVVVNALAYLGKPGTLSITDHLFAGADIVALVVEVKAAPVPGSLSVILEPQIEAKYSGGGYGAGGSDIG